MPFVADSDAQIALSKSIGIDDVEVDDGFTFKEKLRAAYRIDNTVGSFLSKDGNLPDNTITNPDFNPVDFLSEEEKLDDRFLTMAVMADNEDEINSLRDQVERENRDRAILENGGFVPTMMAAIADPINLIPVGGTAYKTYKGGASVLNAGAATAGASALAATATEAGLHYSQVQRTYGESAVNVTAASFLGGILGATPVGIRKMLTDAGHDPDVALREIEDSMNPEGRMANGENASLSVGAAQVLDDINVKGKAAKFLTEKLGFDPLSRTITSEEKATRVLSTRLVENPIAMDRAIGTAAESKIKTKTNGMMFEALDGHLKVFKEYKKNGGTLNRREFGEEVGKAVRNGSDDPDVQKVADLYNSKVYEPVKNDAIKAKLLPEDVDVTTAKNYLNRVWNKQKLSANASRFNDIASSWLIKRQPELDIEDARELSREIFGRIISTPDGRLDYDYKMGENLSKGTGRASGVAGTLKKRSFDIDDALVEEFLENDIEVLSNIYTRKTVPDIELVREFGDVNLSAEIKEIEQAWNKKIEAAKTQKEAIRLGKKRDKDIRDIAAMRDRIRNRFNIADSDNPWVRTARVARDLNYMRLLGGVVASSIPDVGRVVAAEGAFKAFGTGFKALGGGLKGFKLAAREAKLAGVGTDVLTGGRAEVLADVADYAQGGSAFERGVRSAAAKFSSINLMNRWTAGMKQWHAVTTQTRITDDLLKGKYDKRLGQLGIDEPNAQNIAKQLEKYAENIDGAWVANTKDWDAPSLVELWRTALRKESDRVVIVPGQERPLFMSSEMGKTVFQFKTFMFSATQRIMISSLQNQDKHMLQGIMTMISFGAMAYAFKQWDAGREISDDPRVLIAEGIDRSGMLGILMEFNNTAEKISSNSVGFRTMLGVGAPASRYATRSALDSMAGPTFGLAGDFIKTMGAATNQYEWSDSDIRAIRRLIPGQNLTFIRQGFDQLEKEAAEALR
jgi:hypothetical protein